MGEMVTYDDGIPGYLAHSTRPRPGVVVIQEWWGLVEHIKDVCDRLGDAGYNALAPDFYRGESTREPDEAAKKMMELDFPRALKDMSAAADHLLADPNVTGDRVGVIGFCMGGALALALGATRTDVVGAVVPFYGVHPWGGDTKPDYTRINCGVLGHYAELDTSFPPDAARALEAELAGAGIEATINVHPGVDHAFFNDTRPEVYNEDVAADVWQETLDFLDSHLR